MSVFSCSTIGFGGDDVPDGGAGTGPTMIGIRTEAGIAGKGVDRGIPELGGGDACGATLPVEAFMVEVAGGGEAAGGDSGGGGGE